MYSGAGIDRKCRARDRLHLSAGAQGPEHARVGAILMQGLGQFFA